MSDQENLPIENEVPENDTPKEELTNEELDQVAGGDKPVMTTNLSNMRHEMLKAVVNNLRG